MKYILDTHTMLWFIEGSDKLTLKARNEILDNNNQKYMSIASVWEIAIKMSIGKLTFNGGYSALLNLIKQNGFEFIPIENIHINGIISLPFIHKDPFDRLLIATAKSEELTIITVDENIRKYDVDCIW